MGRRIFQLRSLIFYQHEPTSQAEWLSHEAPLISERIRQRGVSAIVIITGDVVSASEYLAFVEFFKNQGFRVRSIHVYSLNREALAGMKKITREIDKLVAESSLCMVISYAKSHALMVVACYLIYTGDSPSSAIRNIRRYISSFPFNADNAVFLYAFSRYIHESSAGGSDGNDTPFSLADCHDCGGSISC